jgi:hypothetical protein
MVNDYGYRSDHKYDSTSGFPTFWHHIKDAVKYTDDHLTVPKVTNAHVDPMIKNKQPVKRASCSNVISYFMLIFPLV